MPNDFISSCEAFFSDLKIHNSRQWFEEHKHQYETMVLEPARDLVIEIGSMLQTVNPEINADPRVNKSIFRIYRDTRFSKDKTPYKTHLGIFLWEGDRKKMENSGFYFHIEPGNVFFAAGLYKFPPHLLKQYRTVVSNPKKNNELHTIIQQMDIMDVQHGRRHYKRFPAGYSRNVLQPDYLLYNALYAFEDVNSTDISDSESIPEIALKSFLKMKSLHDWIVKNI